VQYITITFGIKGGISVDFSGFKANLSSLRCLKIGVLNEKRCKTDDKKQRYMLMKYGHNLFFHYDHLKCPLV